MFRDNAESPRVLSGIDSLYNTRGAGNFDAFDPDSPGASAGLNFEHVISGHENRHNAFTPRHGRYTLRRLPDGRSVELVRDSRDCPWKMASVMRCTLVPPHGVDFEFRCRFHDKALLGRRGYAILFWANYMNDVADVAIHFLGVERAGGETKWIAADAPAGHPHWNGGGTYRSIDAASLEYDEDLSFRLNTWSYDYPRFVKPFYYGRAARGMMYMLMFDRAWTPDDEIRFSLFKFKLNRFPRPAWDFQYVVRRIDEGRDYGFRGRAIWKKFESPDDCLREYEAFRASLPRPQP